MKGVDKSTSEDKNTEAEGISWDPSHLDRTLGLKTSLERFKRNPQLFI